MDEKPPFEYYTSTTATTLLALHHVNALDSKLYQEFYDAMFWLRDHTANLVVKEKTPEDAVAWDVSESASVWATSLAIWAFLGTGYNGPRVTEIKDAAIWLADQQRENGGWGFDCQTDSNVFFTGLTLHTLKLALSSLHLTSSEQKRVERAISFGIQFVLKGCHREGRMAYWSLQINGKAKPDPTLTLYAMWALYEESVHQYQDLIQAGIQFLKGALQRDLIWELRPIAVEAHTKYGTQKVIVSFTPSFPILLLRMGCSPFDDICFGPIRWLEENKAPNGWSLPGYSERTLSFATAYAIWTITNWHKYVVRNSLKEVEEHPVILRALRRRASILVWVIIGLSSILVLANTPVIQFIQDLYAKILPYNTLIQIVASILGILGISGLFPLLRFLDSRIFNKVMSKTVDRIRKFALRLLYAERRR